MNTARSRGLPRWFGALLVAALVPACSSGAGGAAGSPTASPAVTPTLSPSPSSSPSPSATPVYRYDPEGGVNGTVTVDDYTTPKGSHIEVTSTEGGTQPGGITVNWQVAAGPAGFVVNSNDFDHMRGATPQPGTWEGGAIGSTTFPGKIVDGVTHGYRLASGKTLDFGMEYAMDGGRLAFAYAPGGLVIAVWKPKRA